MKGREVSNIEEERIRRARRPASAAVGPRGDYSGGRTGPGTPQRGREQKVQGVTPVTQELHPEGVSRRRGKLVGRFDMVRHSAAHVWRTQNGPHLCT